MDNKPEFLLELSKTFSGLEKTENWGKPMPKFFKMVRHFVCDVIIHFQMATYI